MGSASERLRRESKTTRSFWLKADLVVFCMNRLSQRASSTLQRLVRAFPRALLHFHRLVLLRRVRRDVTPLL